jgi:outer membrane protein assembly factor BamA
MRISSDRPLRGRAAGRALAIVFLLLPLPGQAQTSREAEWRAMRAAKASALTSPERTGLESGIYRYEEGHYMERFERGFAGFHPKLGGLSTGSGFAMGAEFRNDALAAESLLLRLAAQASPQGYQRYEAQIGLPRLDGGRFLLDFTGRYRNYPQEDFFGLGADSSEDNRTSYRLEDANLIGTAGVRAGAWLTVGFRGGLLLTHTGSGTDDRYPSIENRFDDTTAPALASQPDYLYGGPYMEIDYRDSRLNPREGGYYRFDWTSFNDREPGTFSFNRFQGEIRQYFPFWNQRRVIVFRAKTSMVGADTGSRVPFFLQPTLGGSDDLRGFREFRFQDQNLMVMNLEYRWEAFSGLDMAVFGDAGKVFPRRADLDFSDLEADWGFGARFNTANGVFFRVDTAFSHEGTRIFYKFGHAF